MRKILLLGSNGQVGWELQRSLAPLGNLLACDRQQADLGDLPHLEQLIRREQPDIIVNAGAYTAVDKAESEIALARRINAEAPSALAKLALELGIWLVHYSTDYVFDGSGNTPNSEDSPTLPLSIYGKTKLEGEQAIRDSGCNHLIFRTSWAYAARGSNFARTMLRLAQEKNELRVIADQYGAPTSAELIADVTALALQRLAQDSEQSARASGTYHLVASGETNWHQYAQFVIAEASRLGLKLRTNSERIIPISTNEFPLPAKRPSNSRLNNSKLQRTFDLVMPNWEYHVKRMVQETIQQSTL
ncbi:MULTISPECIES: dTDP-4-dehydrorhamnose reductase [unclassified Pseudomonas]|uniref:dTDP-4-dehydrorhamnose reductase n=1 Tax=unclassified Pseudomonas TaxID=196821 RepID=UPI00244D3F10|nr:MULTISPECIES: dTDP-4-dehydrorhamnose reductase [unclassified Pseudomonas]MDG9925369.1 dTDP-4-dehydrorhamnose reductase [Pseudomonas sp. GD04045]MDH0037291.1 dTDP-4-dehydrorhamnose reductase [Pseudomonas sp. GD04019]